MRLRDSIASGSCGTSSPSTTNGVKVLVLEKKKDTLEFNADFAR